MFIANNLAMIDLFETIIRSPMIVLWLMHLFGTIGHFDWLDQSRLHNRSGPRHFWMMAHNHCSLENLVVHRTKVFAYFKTLHVWCQLRKLRCVFRAHSRFSLLTRLVGAHDRAIGPSPNRVRGREEATTLAKSLSPYQS